VIDPREKVRLFEEEIAKNSRLLDIIARNNAPIDSRQDLEQEIRIAFWSSLDRYDGKKSGLGTWFFSVAANTAEDFKRRNQRTKKRDEAVYPNPVFTEQDRDPQRIVEEFTETLGELDRQVFAMYIDDFSYAEMSAALGINEVNLRKRMSRIKEQLITKYKDY
jgi:RNA polymerase sigma factor (sigma-70 family)